MKKAYKQELWALVGIASSLFLALSLFSFNAYDSSWFFFTTNSAVVTNKCGIVGAQFAGLCIFLCGGIALLLPFVIAFVSYLALIRCPWRDEWDRVTALVLIIPTIATLCALYHYDVVADVAAGGAVGGMIKDMLQAAFDRVGSFVVLHTLLVVWLMLIFRASSHAVLHWAYKRMQYMISAIYSRIGMPSLSRALHTVVTMPRAAYAWFARLWRADDVVQAPESMVEFEAAHVADQTVPTIHDDHFWQQFSESSHHLHDHASSLAASSSTTGLSSPITETVSGDGVMLQQEQQQYAIPDVNMLESREAKYESKKIAEELKERSHILEDKLGRFGVEGKVTAIKPGPVVTLFEYQPAMDTKLSKIIALEDDLALALQAMSIRILAPIPGTAVVGFEVANHHRVPVYASTILQSKEFKEFKGKLPLMLGSDTVGAAVIVDLVTMPHLLIAGSTGSGKSVALNAMLISLLCSKTPDELQLILIDPKRLEFASYADIAHLLFPIITDARKAVPVLSWVVTTMEQRYEQMAQAGVRNITDYHKLTSSTQMPYLVVIIDELADLMMTAGNEIEDLITRLSQMSRAAGIHLMVATQRPSVDVITGLIKVNFPSRISFRVSSKVDSRIILDSPGADKLLGRGDMLFLDANHALLQRVHGAYITDKEINTLVTHIKAQRRPDYLTIESIMPSSDDQLHEHDDQLFKDVMGYINEVDEVSISMLQRRFRIGYNRSARIIEALESYGKILPSDGGKTRKVIRS